MNVSWWRGHRDVSTFVDAETHPLLFVTEGKTAEAVKTFEGSRWAIWGNEWTRSEEQQEKRRELCLQYPKLGRAMGLRESFQNILASKSTEDMDWWCRWANSSRLEPFQKLAKSIKVHKKGILAYFDSGITSAAIEAINGKIQLAQRIARGFRSFRYLRACAYLKCAKLDFNLPDLSPA